MSSFDLFSHRAFAQLVIGKMHFSVVVVFVLRCRFFTIRFCCCSAMMMMIVNFCSVFFSVLPYTYNFFCVRRVSLACCFYSYSLCFFASGNLLWVFPLFNSNFTYLFSIDIFFSFILSIPFPSIINFCMCNARIYPVYKRCRFFDKINSHFHDSRHFFRLSECIVFWIFEIFGLIFFVHCRDEVCSIIEIAIYFLFSPLSHLNDGEREN